MSLINLDALEIENAASIVGNDPSSPINPGQAGRIAFAKDTNVLYFAEDETTWIKFLPQEATVGGIGSTPTVPIGSDVDGEGLAQLATGTGFLNGYYTMDTERKEIGIYYSGTFDNPIDPRVFIFETEESYESILQENILGPADTLTYAGQVFSAPDYCWDPEWFATAVDQIQNITLDSITEGDEVSLSVNGQTTTITTSGDNDSDFAAQLKVILQNNHSNFSWSVNGPTVSISAPIGSVILTEGSSSGTGSVTFTEIQAGHAAAPMLEDNSMIMFKNFKDRAGKNTVIAPKYPYINYAAHPLYRAENYDIYNDGSLIESRNTGWSGSYVTERAFDKQLAWLGHGRTGVTPKIKKNKITLGGQLFYHTGIEFGWTGMSGDALGNREYQSLANKQYGLVDGNFRATDKYVNGRLSGMNIPRKSNLFYTNDKGEEPQAALDFSDNQVNPIYYNHVVLGFGGASQSSKIHGKPRRSFENRHFAHIYNSQMLGMGGGGNDGQGGNSVVANYGPQGVLIHNYGIKTSSDKNYDSLWLSPAGGFFSHRITGYNSNFETWGHSQDAAWGGGMDDPFDWMWTDMNYSPYYTGLGYSGIGRRHITPWGFNTGAVDLPATEHSAHWLSNDFAGPTDLSDHSHKMQFKYHYTTGLLPYSYGTTAQNRAPDYFGRIEENVDVTMPTTNEVVTFEKYPVVKNSKYFWNGTQDGYYRTNDPANDGGDWANPNNGTTQCGYYCHIKQRLGGPGAPSTTSQYPFNYINKSKQWPYNMCTLKDGAFHIPPKETIQGIKDGKWSWGPEDEVTFEFIYKSTPIRPNYGDNYWEWQQNSSSHSYAGFNNTYNYSAAQQDGMDHPYSFENMVLNDASPGNYANVQASFINLGAHQSYYWLTIGVCAGRLTVVNQRAGKQGRAGEYPASNPFLMGETLLENNKWYHFAVVKHKASEKNRLELYVNGKLDGCASLVADVSQHGSDYNGGTYYTDTSVDPNIENLPVDNVYVPHFVSHPSDLPDGKGHGNYSWMGEYWGYPVKGNAKYTPDGNGGKQNNDPLQSNEAGTEYSFGWLNVDKVISATAGGLPVEEGKDVKVYYHGDLREKTSNGYGTSSACDMDNFEETVGSVAHYNTISFGSPYYTYSSNGRFGPLQVANKAIYDGDFSSNFTIDDDLGIIDGVIAPKINESLVYVDWSNAPSSSWDYEDLAYFDFKFSAQDNFQARDNIKMETYMRIGDFEYNWVMPTNWQTAKKMPSWHWDTHNYTAVETSQIRSVDLYLRMGYFGEEGPNRNKNLDDKRNSVRSYLLSKYLNVT